MIYFMIFFASLFITFITYKSSNKKVRLFGYILSFLVIFLPHGLRLGIGTDYFKIYVPYFYAIGKGTRQFSEPVFNFLNLIIYNTTGDYKHLFFVCSFLFFLFIYIVIVKKSKNVLSSIALIFLTQCYFYSMNMVRQSIAVAIILFIFLCFDNKNTVKKILGVIFCSLIHSSAILLLPFIFLSRIRITSKTKILILLICNIINTFFSSVIYNIILNNTHYSWYLESMYSNMDLSLSLIIINVAIFIISIFYSKYEKDDENFKICNNMNFFGLCVLSLSTIPLVGRLVRYFTIFQIVLLPFIFNFEKVPKRRFAIKSVVYAMLIFAVISQIFIQGGEQVLPYKSVFGGYDEIIYNNSSDI